MKHEPVNAVENPETGEKVYPHMTKDGQPVLDSGAVEGCDCDPCFLRGTDPSTLHCECPLNGFPCCLCGVFECEGSFDLARRHEVEKAQDLIS